MTNKTLREELLAATKEERVKILFDYLNKHGDEHYEEDVTQMQHGLQAAYLARSTDQDPEYITAALFHDIGHIIADDPEHPNNPTEENDDHEQIAADCFDGIFPDKVIEPILLHVVSKRYLCTKQTDYYDKLSEPSQKSFHLQGGAMSEDELAAFESHPHYQAAVRLRTWDDRAKDVTIEVPALETYREVVLQSLL